MYNKLFIIASSFICLSSISFAAHDITKHKEGDFQSSKQLVMSKIQHYDRLLTEAKQSHSSGAPSIISHYNSYKEDLENLLKNLKETDDVRDKLYELHTSRNPYAGGSY